jgi:IS5 family transposase
MGLKSGERQMSMLIPNVEELVDGEHHYRKILKLFNWTELTLELRECYSKEGRKGFAIEQGFKCLFLQFLEDKSDRQMEGFLKDSLAAKYFCSFGLKEKTPDHCYFCNFRKRIGTKRISNVFKRIVKSLKEAGLVREFYTFVDASKIEACVDSWKARDRAISDAKNDERDDNDNPTMNNKNISAYSSDKDARYGAKSKRDIWLGYKRHVGVDMHQGLIAKVAVTQANVPDGAALKHVAPSQGAVVADKIYSDGKARRELKARKLHSMAIKKRNAKDKNREKDAFLSRLRMPFEGVFSKMPKRARYRGTAKVYLQAVMDSIVHNIKRLVKIEIEAVPLVPL